MNKIDQQIYKDSFEVFLKSTNEKRVILNFLENQIDLTKVFTVLDIGGGNGMFAKPLAHQKKLVTIVEPNSLLSSDLKEQGVKLVNSTWESYNVGSNKYDLIIAAYVFTHFEKNEIAKLLKKMVDALNPNGQILVLAVDSKKGTWRKIHTLFYKWIKYNHNSRADQLDIEVKKYRVKKFEILTSVKTKSYKQMIKALTFDFYKFEPLFTKFKPDILQYLKSVKKGFAVELTMAHNAYIIRK